MTYTDFPLEQIAKECEVLISCGATVYFKWTCGMCGDRVTMTEPNCASPLSKHDEPHCGWITDTQKTGGNYMTIHTPESLQAYVEAKAKGN